MAASQLLALLPLCAPGRAMPPKARAPGGRQSVNLDARSCLGVLQGIEAAGEAALAGDAKGAVRLESKGLRKLAVKKGSSGRKWRDCDPSDGYTKEKHGLAHFRLAVALQRGGAPDAAVASFEFARTFDPALDTGPSALCPVSSLSLSVDWP